MIFDEFLFHIINLQSTKAEIPVTQTDRHAKYAYIHTHAHTEVDRRCSPLHCHIAGLPAKSYQALRVCELILLSLFSPHMHSYQRLLRLLKIFEVSILHQASQPHAIFSNCCLHLRYVLHGYVDGGIMNFSHK